MNKQLNLTVLQWYEMLPVKLRDKAQAYAMEANGDSIKHPTDIVDSLEESVDTGFWWMETDEGIRFWVKLRNNAHRYQSQYLKKYRI